jgi:acetyl-CoA carboxylase carboxyltransferase component
MTDSEEGAARTALEELRLRRQVSAQAGSREVAAGRLSARDRISKLLDEGSFEELGRLAGYGEYEVDGQLRRFTPSNCVIGQGSIDARPLMVVADDASSRGGSSELAVAEKWIYAERMALTFRMPLVRMVDTAGGSVKRVERAGRTQIPGYPLWPSTALMSAVPVVSVAFGACVGLGAVRVIGAHFSVMVKDQAQVFAAGPPVIKQGLGQDVDKETLGGWRLCTETSGIVRNAAEDEDDALAQARRFLSYLPENAWQIPPHQPCTDPVNRCDAALNQAIPENPRRVYMAPQIVAAIADRGSLFELAPGFGASVRTYLARLDGYAVGLMINDPCVMGGALTRAAAQKTELSPAGDQSRRPAGRHDRRGGRARRNPAGSCQSRSCDRAGQRALDQHRVAACLRCGRFHVGAVERARRHLAQPSFRMAERALGVDSYRRRGRRCVQTGDCGGA